MGIGVSAVVVPAYLGEVAPARLRGRIVEAYEVLLCIGMLMAMLIDAALQNVAHNWRWMVGAPVIPALFLACKPWSWPSLQTLRKAYDSQSKRKAAQDRSTTNMQRSSGFKPAPS